MKSDNNVISIDNGKPIPNGKPKDAFDLIESDDEKFHNLIRNYQKACMPKYLKDPLIRKAIAIEIQSYEINQPMELILKISVLEKELGFRTKRRPKDEIYDKMMFLLFKRSMVRYLETTLYEGVPN